MTTDNKTLADVQPGGRVRLGDGLPPLPKAGYVTGGDFGHEAHNAFTPEQMREYALAALSAQPSPGGQDALDCIGRIEEAIEFRVPHDIYAAVHGELAELKAALAARQPVGQIVGYMDPDAEFLLPRPDGCVLMGKIEVCLWRTPSGKYTKPLYDASAQAVDLEELRRAVCVVGVVGQIDGHDVVRRNSVLDVIDTRRQRLADSQAVGK